MAKNDYFVFSHPPKMLYRSTDVVGVCLPNLTFVLFNLAITLT